MTSNEAPELLTPAQFAAAMNVNPKTVARWAQNGKIPRAAIVITLGGHRRYAASFVHSVVRGEPWDGQS